MGRLQQIKDIIRYHESLSGSRNLKWRRIFNRLAAGGRKKKRKEKWQRIDELPLKKPPSSELKSTLKPTTFLVLSLHPFQSNEGFAQENRIHMKRYSFPVTSLIDANALKELYFSSHQLFTKENYHLTLDKFHYEMQQIAHQTHYYRLNFCPNENGVFRFEHKDGTPLQSSFITELNGILSEIYSQYYGTFKEKDTKVGGEIENPFLQRLPSIPTDYEEAYENLTGIMNMEEGLESLRDGLFKGNGKVHESINVNVKLGGIYFTQIIYS